MAKRKQFFYLRYPKPLDRPVYFDELGVQVKMAAVVLTGHEVAALVWLPGLRPIEPMALAPSGKGYRWGYDIEPTIEEWAAILQATDSPEIFELDKSGVVKAIHRKSMRAIGGSLQWRVWRRDGFRCLYCGVDGDENHPLTVDHFVPVELGGQDTEDNLIAACRACNKRKGSLPPEWFCKLEELDYFGLNEYIHGKASALFISHLN